MGNKYIRFIQTRYFSNFFWFRYKDKHNSNENSDIFQNICKILKKSFETKIIVGANVPIIKAYDNNTVIKLDISVNNSNGVENSMIIMNEIKDKKLRNIMIILKILLRNNN